MVDNLKSLVELAGEHGELAGRYGREVRSYLDQCHALDGDEFWPLLDQLAKAITENHRGLTDSKRAIGEFVRSRLFDQKARDWSRDHNTHRTFYSDLELTTWQKLAQFTKAYRKVKAGLSRTCGEWTDLDMGDDGFGDFIDSMVLGGMERCQAITTGKIATMAQLRESLAGHPLERFILRGENYIEMFLEEALGEKLPSIARHFQDTHDEKVEKDPESVVLASMDLEAVAATLALILEKTTRPFPGHVQINLTSDEHAALTKVVHMFQFADLVNYKRAQDSYPRLLQAVKLVIAIADNPGANPGEKISLATKTRAQLDSAVKFAEKL